MMQEAQQSLPQTGSDSASRLWTDAQLQHLHWYLSCTTEPQGSCPVADKAPAIEKCDKAEESSPAKEASARGPPTVGLNPLICYLEREVSRQKLSRRVSANRRGEDIGLEGNGLKGQEAVDAYVSQLVTVIRNFPYKQIDKDPEVGTWVRDDVVAPMFAGSWDFYANKKRDDGFDLPGLHKLLCGEQRLLERLHWAWQLISSSNSKRESQT